MNSPLISIIIPAYNIEQYIERTLNSVTAQTYKNLEIIVVDDGSTDNTGAIIDEYTRKDKRVIAIHKKNGGVSSARICGLNSSHGEYIGFVDGDDLVEANMFEHLLKNAVEHNADISHCGYNMVFPNGKVDKYYGTGNQLLHNNREALCELLRGNFIEPGLWNKLYKRNVVIGFENNSIWDSTIKNNEDLLMNYLLFSKAERSYYEDVCLYNYMLRKGSAATSQKKRNKITDLIYVITAIKDDLSEDTLLYPIIYERYLRALINTALQNNWVDDAKQARKDLKNELNSKDFKNNCHSQKLRYMVATIVYALPLYKLVRKIYDNITGVSKKYDID